MNPTRKQTSNGVNVELYRFEGKWWFFKVKSACPECDVSEAILKNLQKQFPQKINLVIKPWLNNWPKLLFGHFAWHAPIVIVDGKKFSQGIVLETEKLVKLLTGDA